MLALQQMMKRIIHQAVEQHSSVPEFNPLTPATTATIYHPTHYQQHNPPFRLRVNPRGVYQLPTNPRALFISIPFLAILIANYPIFD